EFCVSQQVIAKLRERRTCIFELLKSPPEGNCRFGLERGIGTCLVERSVTDICRECLGNGVGARSKQRDDKQCGKPFYGDCSYSRTSPITPHARLTDYLKPPDSRAGVHWMVTPFFGQRYNACV